MGGYIFNRPSTAPFVPRASVNIQRQQLGIASYSTDSLILDTLAVGSTATINSLTVTSGFRSTAVTVAGGKINATPIGATAASSADFTALAASSAVTGKSFAATSAISGSSGTFTGGIAASSGVSGSSGTFANGISASSAGVAAIAVSSAAQFGVFATSDAPAYAAGKVYFDTTLNKFRVGGATTWETITSI